MSSGPGTSDGDQKGLRVSLIPSDPGAGAGPDLRKRVLVLVFALVIEALVIGGAYFYVLRLTEGQGTSLDNLTQRSEAVIESIKEKELAAEDMVNFDKQARAVEESLKFHITWSSFFDLVESQTKPNVKYVNFVGDADSGVVSLSAMGKTFRDVAEQIVAFREHPMVESVQINSAAARINELGEVVGVAFSMVITMDLNAWRPEMAMAQAQ